MSSLLLMAVAGASQLRAEMMTFLAQPPMWALVLVIMNTSVDPQTYVVPTDAQEISDGLCASKKLDASHSLAGRADGVGRVGGGVGSDGAGVLAVDKFVLHEAACVVEGEGEIV